MAKAIASKFKVGDQVLLKIGTRDVAVRIIEDRGRIGKGGRRLLRVERVRKTTDANHAYEVPADELKARSSRPQTPSRSRRSAHRTVTVL